MRAFCGFLLTGLILPSMAAAQPQQTIEALHRQARSAVVRGMPPDLATALELWGQARRLAHEQGDFVTESAILNNMGVTWIKLEHSDAAVADFRQALRLAELAEHASNQVSALYNLGRTFESSGRSDEALASYRSALRVLDRLPEHIEIRTDIENRVAHLQERFEHEHPDE